MDYPIVITLPFASPSANELLRWHWRRRSKFHHEIRDMIGTLIMVHKYPVAHMPMAMEVMRVGPRPLDYDNLVGGFKPILDALVKEKLLKDDSDLWLRSFYKQMAQKRARWTQILLYPTSTHKP